MDEYNIQESYVDMIACPQKNHINPLRAKFYVMPFLHTDMAQVFEIFLQVRQELTYYT